MKKFVFAFVALIATVVGLSGNSVAQAPRAPGNYQAGQAYMMMPAGVSYAPVAQAGCTTPTCGAGGCTSPGCSGSSCLDCCCAEGWTHDYFAYGGFTYLRARDAEVAYAVAANGPIVPGASVIQRSPVAVVDPDYQPGFFVGFGKVIDDCSSIGVQYSKFESTTNDSITTLAPLVIRSLVAHPSTFNGAFDGLTAQADLFINYDILDVDYRNLLAYDCDYKINYLVGFRAAQMEQRFNSAFSFNGTQTVRTDLDFYGAGLRLGLEAERYASRGLVVYGKSYYSALPGEFRADYDQINNLGNGVVDTAWKAGRLVSILDLEVGLGWRNQCDTVRLNIGYMFSSWMNVVKTNEWIRGVQSNDFIDMSSHMTFDGLTARLEARW